MKKDKQYLGGPYRVEFSKPYKPVFIVYLDLMLAITFFTISLMWYWSKLLGDTPLSEFSEFIPIRITVIWFVLFIKFFFDVFYLSQRFGSDKLNRSEVTSYLYWFRIWYDIIVLGGILVIFTYIWKHKSKKLMISNSFKMFVIIVPKLIMELFIYRFSLLPAYKRSVYQKFSKWRKG